MTDTCRLGAEKNRILDRHTSGGKVKALGPPNKVRELRPYGASMGLSKPATQNMK
jgi:hypothetical protein